MALTNEQHALIIREYDLIRSANMEATQKKQKEIYDKYPELQAWENRVVTLRIAKSRFALEGQAQQQEEIEDEITMLLVRRLALLESIGLTEEDMGPIYTCKDCQDTGYIRNQDGTVQKCKCFIRREMEILYNQSGIRQLLDRENFSKLRFDYCEGEDRERLSKAVEISREFIDTFDNDYRNIVFCGTVGTGKSFLSCCIAHELLERRHSVIYLSSQKLFEHLAQHQFGSNRDEKNAFASELQNCELLIIDDLGTELTNSFVASALFGLINERHLRRQSTIISTNLGLPELRDRYSERVLSRLTGSYTFIRLSGPDVRALEN